jgi:hypothetical protein
MFGSVKDNESNRFRPSGLLSKVAVTIEQDPANPIPVVVPKQAGNILFGIIFDSVQITYPTTISEEYHYSLAGVLQATVFSSYTDRYKKKIVSISRITYAV